MLAYIVCQAIKERNIAMNEHFGSGASITLGEAIQKLRASDESDMTNKMSAEITQAFEQHDAVHILFNCDTSIQDEIAAHIWMVFATTAKISEMHRAVANQEHRNVLSGIGHLKLIGIWFVSLPRIIGIIFKSLRMKKRLAIEELSKLKQQSIIEIRREHGIVL
ncbi:MAG: hypothetical protein JGK03_16665 [Microcoleus sp. PH2017_25_DOB_D_A]|uniref:hypothetical protein n=2 Tax=Microcoleus TaxID=44471 RepID=UPI001DCF6405|nr:hypothetical protein [Microcoleus sp. PH2017_30_WIL_O_A]MCC3493876.1 hypothetical protein [Microcoleus sp. PH2017_16_JOR_D_A]MCC3518188.1 hypothetical protein [Microcoleus sp. PH2017_18_LLB_O_A]MCC3535776.1 hypothetical protein [Microcoleus sp. PH2017_25_DOB_D_A]